MDRHVDLKPVSLSEGPPMGEAVISPVVCTIPVQQTEPPFASLASVHGVDSSLSSPPGLDPGSSPMSGFPLMLPRSSIQPGSASRNHRTFLATAPVINLQESPVNLDCFQESSSSDPPYVPFHLLPAGVNVYSSPRLVKGRPQSAAKNFPTSPPASPSLPLTPVVVWRKGK